MSVGGYDYSVPFDPWNWEAEKNMVSFGKKFKHLVISYFVESYQSRMDIFAPKRDFEGLWSVSAEASDGTDQDIKASFRSGFGNAASSREMILLVVALTPFEQILEIHQFGVDSPQG